MPIPKKMKKLMMIQSHAVVSMSESPFPLCIISESDRDIEFPRTFEGVERLIAKRLGDLWEELEKSGVIKVNHRINSVTTYPVEE